ncbi:hypothetical protein [Sphingobacterium sp. BIGb0165]|nr:hypothetical protein [Sphingobacterium sp. BIGb0165]MCS4228038.1 hypothetical protein [Sphingobacterium sp. BIGb0165]
MKPAAENSYLQSSTKGKKTYKKAQVNYSTWAFFMLTWKQLLFSQEV